MQEELKALVQEHAGFTPSISGGNGRTVDSAIVIHNDGIHEYKTVEKAIFWALAKHADKHWETLEDHAFEKNGRHFQSYLLEVRGMQQGKVHHNEQSIFFDITEFRN